jgi:hypothetical protein
MAWYIIRIHCQNIRFEHDGDPDSAFEKGKLMFEKEEGEKKDPAPELYIRHVPSAPKAGNAQLAVNDGVDDGPLADVDRRH